MVRSDPYPSVLQRATPKPESRRNLSPPFTTPSPCPYERLDWNDLEQLSIYRDPIQFVSVLQARMGRQDPMPVVPGHRTCPPILLQAPVGAVENAECGYFMTH
jgi:hypothetical protein